MVKIPSPQSLGLPEKFDSWRPVQEEMLRVMITSQKRHDGICGPVGSGKSAVLVGYARYTGLSTCIVTQNKGLANQYMSDYGSMGMVDIRGRDNYPCQLRDEYTCSDGYAARCPYKGSVACPASNAEIRAALSPLVVTNYAKWTAAKKFGQGMDHFQMVIFDEAHSCVNALAEAMRTNLNNKEIEDTLGLDFPSPSQIDDIAVWKGWASEAKISAEQEMRDAYNRVKESRDPKPSLVRHFSHMKNLVKRLTIIQTAAVNNWIVEEVEKGYQFDPVRATKYGEAMLLLHVPRIIFASATIREKTLKMSGCRDIDYQFREFPSDFDPKDSPIYYVPTMTVSYKNPDLRPLWNRLDQIATKHTDRKGGVHTVSYARREAIMNYSRYAGMMMFNEQGEPPTDMIERFKESEPGTILVSPSFGTGYDFPGEALEWQFMCTVPFEPPSKIVKAREDIDPEYRSYRAAQTMDQAFGRGTRYKGDRCANFIGDDKMKWFVWKNRHLLSNNFHRRYREVEYLPQPLKKL